MSDFKSNQNSFFTISRTAEIIGVQSHVLRFWETKFSQIKIGPFTVKIGEYQNECRYIIYDSNQKKFGEGKNTRDEYRYDKLRKEVIA